MPPELSENQKCHFLSVSSVLGGMSAVNNLAFTLVSEEMTNLSFFQLIRDETTVR